MRVIGAEQTVAWIHTRLIGYIGINGDASTMQAYQT